MTDQGDGPIAAQVGEELDGIRQWAEHGPCRVVKSRGDAALALARMLIDHGYDPDRRYEVWRGNMRCLSYRSLGAAAGLLVEERNDGKSPPRLVRYKPQPAFLAGGNFKDASNDPGIGNGCRRG